jgi:ABC-2 type transport system permease protein
VKLSRVRAVLRREAIELRRNRLILLTMAILPFVLTVAAVGTLAFLSSIDERTYRAGAVGPLPQSVAALGSPKLAMLSLLADQFLFMLALIPLALPSTIAAHAIVGEKVERTLEPLLATPISTAELLLAKCVVAVVPATLITQAAYVVTVFAFSRLCPPEVFALTVRPAWVLGFALVVPGMAMLSALLAVTASSRVNDPRTAQGLVGFLVIPVMGVGVSTVFGAVFLDVRLTLLAVLGVALGVAAMLALAVRVFSREAILTRWK